MTRPIENADDFIETLRFYILLFRNDALFKLGIAGNSSARLQELCQVESLLEESYQVAASDNSLIRALENLAKSVCRELRSLNPLISVVTAARPTIFLHWWSQAEFMVQRLKGLGGAVCPRGLMIRVTGFGRDKEEARRFWGETVKRLTQAVQRLPRELIAKGD
jgi:hypothetical protein